MPHGKPNQTKPTTESLERPLNEAIPLTEFLASIGDWRIKKAVAWLHTEPAEDWTCQSLGERFRLCSESFRHLFRKEIGISLCEYLHEIRLHHAVRLLDETSLSLTEIAEKTGWPNELAFRRTYLKKFGRCPSQHLTP